MQKSVDCTPPSPTQNMLSNGSLTSRSTQPRTTYGGGPLCHGPRSDPKNKKMYKQYSAVAQLRGARASI